MVLHSKKTPKIPIDDEKIIELYFERDENAIVETDHKYGGYLFSVVCNMVSDRLDCEECVNDTYLGAWNAIPPARPYALKAFLTTIARRIAIKRYHKKSKQKEIPSEMTVSLSELADFISGDEDAELGFDAERLGATISAFIRSLPERRRYIFMSRYYVSEPIDSIARELGLSRSTVNKELAAIRYALKEKLESEGYSV